MSWSPDASSSQATSTASQPPSQTVRPASQRPAVGSDVAVAPNGSRPPATSNGSAPSSPSLQRELAQVDAELEPLPDPETVKAARREHGQLTKQLTGLADQHVDVHQHDPPRYLLATLGTPPEDPHGRRRWREAARAIELYRLRWDITDPDRPIGDEPADGLAREDHRRLTADLTRHHRELTAARDQTLEPRPRPRPADSVQRLGWPDRHAGQGPRRGTTDMPRRSQYRAEPRRAVCSQPVFHSLRQSHCYVLAFRSPSIGRAP